MCVPCTSCRQQLYSLTKMFHVWELLQGLDLSVTLNVASKPLIFINTLFHVTMWCYKNIKFDVQKFYSKYTLTNLPTFRLLATVYVMMFVLSNNIFACFQWFFYKFWIKLLNVKFNILVALHGNMEQSIDENQWLTCYISTISQICRPSLHNAIGNGD